MAKKYLPAQTLAVYESIRVELTELAEGFGELAEHPDIKKTHATSAQKKLRSRMVKFIDEELYMIDPTDRIMSSDIWEYRSTMPYRHGIEDDVPARLWERWCVLYKFLSKRVVEYQYSDMTEESYLAFREKYGIYLVTIHETICKTGLPGIAKSKPQKGKK